MTETKYEVGQRVLVETSRSWYGNHFEVATVTNVTPSGRVTANINSLALLFNPDGWERGNRNGRRIRPFDQSKLDEQEHDARIRMMQNVVGQVRWRNLPDSTIEAVYKLVEEAREARQ